MMRIASAVDEINPDSYRDDINPRMPKTESIISKTLFSI